MRRNIRASLLLRCGVLCAPDPSQEQDGSPFPRKHLKLFLIATHACSLFTPVAKMALKLSSTSLFELIRLLYGLEAVFSSPSAIVASVPEILSFHCRRFPMASLVSTVCRRLACRRFRSRGCSPNSHHLD